MEGWRAPLRQGHGGEAAASIEWLASDLLEPLRQGSKVRGARAHCVHTYEEESVVPYGWVRVAITGYTMHQHAPAKARTHVP